MKKIAALVLILLGGGLILYRMVFAVAPSDPAALEAEQAGAAFPVLGVVALAAGLALLALSYYGRVRPRGR